jgi:tetratricopeptide (TPR) repeat protein
MQRGMFEHAIQEVTQHLAQFPDDSDAFTMLAICESQREKHDIATQHAQRAQALQPDNAHAHFAMALVMFNRKRYAEAQHAIEEALRLSPGTAMLHALRGQVLFSREKWREALASCDQALAIDPEDTVAISIKAMAARNLGLKDVSDAQVRAALAAAPNDSEVHSVAGWRSLDHGDRKQAALHFREALRLDPTSEPARQGMLETLRATNVLYRVIHRYFLWMSKLTTRWQWGMILGAYFLYRALLYVARNVPAAAPFIWPLLIAYVLFVFSTWFAQPLTNALLIFHPWGRLALKRRERWGGIITAAMLSCAFACMALFFIVSSDSPWQSMAIIGMFFFLGSSLPLATTFVMDDPKPRLWMALYTSLVVTVGLLMLLLSAITKFTNADFDTMVALISIVMMGFALVVIGSTFVANVLSSITWRK